MIKMSEVMKKNLFVTALAFLALLSTSCSKDEHSRSISFTAACPKTKAVETTTSSLQADGIFWWDGWFDGSNAFASKTATWDDANTVWNTTEYWPDDYSKSLDFWAYAPDAFGTITYAADHLSMSFNYAPLSTGTSVAVEQKDLIVAYGGNNTFNQVGHVDHRVPLEFNHALAAIRYKVGDITAYSTYAQRITSISFNDLAASGTCVAATDGTFAWTPSTAKASYTQAFGGAAITTGEVLNDRIGGAMLMIVPQTLTSANTMTLAWSLDGVAQTSRIKALNTASGITLEAGKIYTFTIGIEEREPIVLEVSVADWVEEEITL